MKNKKEKEKLIRKIKKYLIANNYNTGVFVDIIKEIEKIIRGK